MITHRQPLIEALAIVLSTDDLACRLLLIGREDLFLTIVLADHVENIGEAVVVVVGSLDVRAKESLGDGPGRVVLVKRIDEPTKGLFRFLLVGVIVADLVSSAVDYNAGMIAIAANGVADVDL